MNTTRILSLALLAAGAAFTKLAAQDPAAPPAAEKPAEPPGTQKTEMEKWLAATDAQWQATFNRDVVDAHAAELKKLAAQYGVSLEAALTKATAAGDLDGAVALRNEHKRFSETNFVPEQDDATDAAPVKQIRAATRVQLAKIEQENAARTKALHAKYDATLAQAQAQLTQAKRLDDALLVKAKREEIAAAWSTPAVATAPVGSAPPAIASIGTPRPAVPSGVPTTVPTGIGFNMHRFFNKLKAAAANPRILKNSLSKRERGKSFQDIPKEGAYLVGFEITKGDWFGAPLFKSLQPIYMTAAGKVRGEVYGLKGRGAFTVEARDGYAVSELSFLDGNFFWSLQMTFMKVDAFHQNLDRKDSYSTELFGDLSRHKEKPKKVGGDGAPIIGIFGFAGEEMNALGIIQAP